MTKKSKKKLEEEEENMPVYPTNKAQEATLKAEEAKQIEKAKQYAVEQAEIEARTKANLKVARKIADINSFLESEGLGQNARKRVHVLFDELRRLKCNRHKLLGE